jgi:hypothetical protein
MTTTPSNVISRRTAVVLGDVLNEAFTRLVQLSYEPLQIERRVDGDLLYDFLVSRSYDEPFCNYMRSLQGERALKDAVIRIHTGSFWSQETPANVDREKLGQQVLVMLARDILRDPKQQKLYYKEKYIEPLLAVLSDDGYMFEGGNLLLLGPTRLPILLQRRQPCIIRLDVVHALDQILHRYFECVTLKKRRWERNLVLASIRLPSLDNVPSRQEI